MASGIQPPRSPVHSNTGLEYKPGLLVAKATGKGFNKPLSILVDSETSVKFFRRCSFEGNLQYAELLQAPKGNMTTFRLATGTLVPVTKVFMNLVVRF